MTAIEKIACSSSQEELLMRNHMGRPWVGQEARQVNGEQETLFWFLLVKDRLSRLNMASLNNFSGLWVIGAVPRCLVPGPGVIGAGGR